MACDSAHTSACGLWTERRHRRILAFVIAQHSYVFLCCKPIAILDLSLLVTEPE